MHAKVLPSLGCVALALTFILAAPAGAQTPPDEALLDEALRARIERAVERADQAAERAQRGQPSGVPTVRMENLPEPLVPNTAIDVEALAKQYAAAANPIPSNEPTLLAFVSFSMPEASLARMVADAEARSTTLVLRGLVGGSLKTTMAAAQALIGDRTVAWVIDSEAFTRFGVTAVPTYVLLRSGATPSSCATGQCFGDQDYVRVSGDISIDYALERIEMRAEGFEQDARALRAGRAGAQQ